jgi:branched-chain amino acid transport system permease protein
MAQNIVNGLLVGGLYGVVGLGFSLVYGVMNILNVAYGAMVVLGGYVGYFSFTELGLDPLLGAIGAGIVLFAFGFLVQWFVVDRVMRSGIFMPMVLTFGLELLLINLMTVAFTADFRSVTPSYADSSWTLFGLIISQSRLFVFAACIFATILLLVFLKSTRLGSAIRAVASDPFAAQLAGITIRPIYAITFGLGAAMAGAAGSFVLPVVAISPVSGVTFSIKAFIVAVLGGLGNPVGAIAGGIVLGMAEVLGSAYIGPGYSTIVGIVLLLVVLLLRPRGLFGREFFAEVHL